MATAQDIQYTPSELQQQKLKDRVGLLEPKKEIFNEIAHCQTKHRHNRNVGEQNEHFVFARHGAARAVGRGK
jgi:hypothetical protein